MAMESHEREFLEFFAGIGLVHESLRPFGWHAALANDNSPDKAIVYALNYPKTTVNTNDIRSLTAQALPTVALATASFPCIDLSQAGGRLGLRGNKSSIVWSYLDLIQALSREGRSPQFLLLENVPGLLYHHHGHDIDALLNTIAEAGYCIDLVQVDARHFLPQARNRVFIIAVHGHHHATRDLSMPDSHIRRYKVRETYQRNRDLPWVFFDFPQLPSRRLFELAQIIERIPTTDDRWWGPHRMDYFWERLEHDHRPRLETIARTEPERILTAVRRGRRRGLREQIINLRFDGLASCLRTPKGGSSIQFVVYVRDGATHVRRITGLESARLQGVSLPGLSPNFVLPSSEHDRLFAFGDAVCVPVVRWVFRHSIQQFVESHQLVPHGQIRMF